MTQEFPLTPAQAGAQDRLEHTLFQESPASMPSILHLHSRQPVLDPGIRRDERDGKRSGVRRSVHAGRGSFSLTNRR